jgi:hypothetical protein
MHQDLAPTKVWLGGSGILWPRPCPGSELLGFRDLDWLDRLPVNIEGWGLFVRPEHITQIEWGDSRQFEPTTRGHAARSLPFLADSISYG